MMKSASSSRSATMCWAWVTASPSSRRAAAQRVDTDTGNADLWVVDLDTAISSRMTLDAAMDGDPADDAAELPAARSSQPEFDFAEDEADRPARRSNRNAAAAAVAMPAGDAVAATGDAAEAPAKRVRKAEEAPTAEAVPEAGGVESAQREEATRPVGTTAPVDATAGTAASLPSPTPVGDADAQVDAISAGTEDAAEAAASTVAVAADAPATSAAGAGTARPDAPEATEETEAVSMTQPASGQATTPRPASAEEVSAAAPQSRGLFDTVDTQAADTPASAQADMVDAELDAAGGDADAPAPSSPAATAADEVVASQEAEDVATDPAGEPAAGRKDDQVPGGA